VTEYGAQALPSKAVLEQMIPPQALFPPVWSYYARRCFQPEYQFLFIPQPASLDQFIKDSQAYQARVIQYHSEYYRRHKFAPCNGAHLFCFNDCWPAITWSVVDYERNRKPGFEALRRAMSPLQALAEFRDDEATIWLVNDYPHAFPALTLRWAIRDKASQVLMAEGEMRCEVGPNTLERIGPLPGPVESNIASLYLEVRDGEVVVAENFYRIGQAGTRISTS
jgi:beta-mannosidase